jgi:hypothetical protein
MTSSSTAKAPHSCAAGAEPELLTWKHRSAPCDGPQAVSMPTSVRFLSDLPEDKSEQSGVTIIQLPAAFVIPPCNSIWILTLFKEVPRTSMSLLVMSQLQNPTCRSSAKPVMLSASIPSSTRRSITTRRLLRGRSF